MEQAAAVLHSRIKIGCTGCRYCMPCPMGVDIPDNFSIWNRLGMFQQPEAVKKQWTECFPDSEKALHCVRCGKCETVCPQKLPISASLARLQEELAHCNTKKDPAPVNCTPFVRQYGILFRKWGVLYAKGTTKVQRNAEGRNH